MNKLNLIAVMFAIFSFFCTGCDDTESEDEYNVTIINSGEAASEYSCPSQEAYEACQSKSCGDCSHTSGPNLYQ